MYYIIMASSTFLSVVRQAGLRSVAGLVGTLVLVPAFFFLAAGRLDLWQGWALALVTTMGLAGSRVLLIRRNPNLALERARAGDKAGVKGWDRVLMPLSMLFYMPVTWIVAGLDLRWGWSPAPRLDIQLVALLFLALGYILAIWAMLENAFFSTYVRIQTERDHHVVSTGPYAWIRHPGYAGGVLSGLATPLLLGSLWALLPALVGIAVLVARTALEDRTLRAELPGYAGYTRLVRFRLIPGIW